MRSDVYSSKLVFFLLLSYFLYPSLRAKRKILHDTHLS